MEYIRLGNSGLKITELTFGTALTIGTEYKDIDFARTMVKTAWDNGIRSFDVSNNYGDGQAEILLGTALSEYPREEYVIATKGSWPIGEDPYHKGLSRKHILWAFDKSLERLGLSYVDIYYAHRYDPETPMEEIVRTFNSLISNGRVRYWGTSEWPCSALAECHNMCDRLGMEKPIVEQCFYSYAVQKASTNGVKDFCSEHGVGMLAFGPLAQGLLTGKYKQGIPEGSRIAKSEKIGYDKTKNIYKQNETSITRFLEICEKFNIVPLAAAIRWCIYNRIYPVIGASTPEQLVQNCESLLIDIPLEMYNQLSAI